MFVYTNYRIFSCIEYMATVTHLHNINLELLHTKLTLHFYWNDNLILKVNFDHPTRQEEIIFIGIINDNYFNTNLL